MKVQLSLFRAGPTAENMFNQAVNRLQSKRSYLDLLPGFGTSANDFMVF